jgi:poly(3-hydroxybutyrate) depolymerase
MSLESVLKISRVVLVLSLGTASSLSASVTKTVTALSSLQNPSTYGQTVTFVAMVSSSKGAPPDGETVSFMKGQTVLGTGALNGGSVTLATSTLAGGTASVTAVYTGDSTFGGSTSKALKQVVTPDATTTTLASSQNPSNVGQPVTFTASVTSSEFSGTVPGFVTFYKGSGLLGTVSLSGGVANYTTSSLAVGTDSITAAYYKGSSSFTTSTSNTVSQTVGAGTSTNSTMIWDGVTRYYGVFLPTALPANPAMLLMLHGTWHTTDGGADSTGAWSLTGRNWGWQKFANQYGFILVQPVATWDPASEQWNWNAYFMDGAFPPAESGTCTDPPATGCPDDAGFLRQLIVHLRNQYHVNPNAIFVTGFSSGAQMSERVGVEISDLVAAIAPVSGQLEGQQTAPPPVLTPGNALAPISVQEWAGTLDEVLWPCGYGTTKYNGVLFWLDTVDDTFNYWVKQDECTTLATTQTLCSGVTANPNVTDNIATGCRDNTEIQFNWEDGVGHIWRAGNLPAIWTFLSNHPK